MRIQRNGISRLLPCTPSLVGSLGDPDWWANVQDDALDVATRDTGLEGLPETCPWDKDQVLDHDWLPDCAFRIEGTMPVKQS